MPPETLITDLRPLTATASSPPYSRSGPQRGRNAYFVDTLSMPGGLLCFRWHAFPALNRRNAWQSHYTGHGCRCLRRCRPIAANPGGCQLHRPCQHVLYYPPIQTIVAGSNIPSYTVAGVVNSQRKAGAELSPVIPARWLSADFSYRYLSCGRLRCGRVVPVTGGQEHFFCRGEVRSDSRLPLADGLDGCLPCVG